MGMTASEATAVARDANHIRDFRSRMDKKIEESANLGEYAAYESIPWEVSETALEIVVKEYKDRGFNMDYEDAKHIKCVTVNGEVKRDRRVVAQWGEEVQNDRSFYF